MSTAQPYEKGTVAWLRAANMADSMSLVYIQAVRVFDPATKERDPVWSEIVSRQGDALTEIIKLLAPPSDWDYLWNHLVNGESAHRFDPSLFRKVKA